ncbi:MAG: hypothetical protein A3F83_16710 [Candidatus Glassbacteria bacterium RIFCSPLOWO2_12_FULL_58_11]|uniref:Polysaccharide chain length determinant N-terminal domain-containing protein n=1 Tax=Candidatus Glassbacteria bacterium RIFCSPLOWO2_12_FULL_58_11 TaxID=1817867 RepID=A0A1F5YPV5_9BACT|nr:MAG: hypothetical protein A3F83_16710 [Candidatus Glassbacteria bacterium RIFCSPLOWO2_12_FULL_58_11]
MAESGFQAIDSLSIILRRWRLLAAVCLVTGLAAAVVNFVFLPRWFKSTTVLLPPQDRSSFGGLGMLLSNIQNLPGSISRIATGMTGFSQSQYLFVVVLNSETVADSLIEKFDLQRVYKKKYHFETVKELRTHTSIDFPPEGQVVVSVEAKEDSVLAFNLTREYVIQLNNILADRGIHSASNKAAFLEARMDETRKNLVVLEDSLRHFQESNRVVTSGEQPEGLLELITMPIKSSLEMLALIQADRESKSIELRVKQGLYRREHPDITLLKKEISELDRTIMRIEKSMPGIALDFSRIYRSLKLQEELFLLLSAQYEETRINEADDTPSAIVLDEARIPEYKYRPRRLLNIGITVGAALILAMIFVVLGERLKAGPRADRV